ncbi:NADH-quinone oxidoreductase subunit C [bacterium]|nr:NADH-quinone oxidoreductase subunit C [bacterium]
MDWKSIKTGLQDQFADKIQRWHEHNTRRIYLDIDAEMLEPVVTYLFNTLQSRFIIASAVDKPNNMMEIIYHFDFLHLPQVLSLRVVLSKDRLEIESIAPIIVGAEWIEREIHELFGITFKNHPNPVHLLLPDDWPEGNYPLRRDQ